MVYLVSTGIYKLSHYMLLQNMNEFLRPIL